MKKKKLTFFDPFWHQKVPKKALKNEKKLKFPLGIPLKLPKNWESPKKKYRENAHFWGGGGYKYPQVGLYLLSTIKPDLKFSIEHWQNF